MRFCTRCSQERTGDNRFCTVCGTELVDSPDGGAGPQEGTPTETFAIPKAPAADEHPPTQLAPQQPPSWGQSADPPATRTVLSPQSQPAYPPAAPPASPGHPGQYQPGGYTPPGGYAQPGGYTYPGGYSQAGGYSQGGYSQAGGYSHAGGYPPAGPGLPDQYRQPGDYPGGPRRSRSGKTAALVAAAIVVVAAAGVGAFALVSHLHSSGNSAQQPSQPTSAPPSSPASQAQSPTSAPPSSSTASTPGSPSTVTLAPAAASGPHASQVQTLFTTYFDGINHHDYAEFASTLDAGMQAKNPQSTFDKGYATTTDSAETITSISGSASGLTAVVTFTSRQDSADSPDKSACNNYRLTLPLVPQGSSYVITTPPSGYATYSDC